MPEFRTPAPRFRTGLFKTATAVAFTATLVGCASQGNNVKSVSSEEPTFMRLTEERVFAQALRQRYLELATNAYDRGDLERSDFYSLRAIMAVEGKLADPGTAAGGDSSIEAARTRLINTFSHGARVGSPDLAARAQAAYDCWSLESQPGGDANIASACAANAEAALTQLEVIGAGTRLAAARDLKPEQYVINGETPSQTINVGGATIQIVNQPTAGEAPAPSAPPPQAEFTPPPPVQQRAALARTIDGVEPIESTAGPSFVVEAPIQAPSNGFQRSGQQIDTVIPTVPFQDGYDPIDLIPDFQGSSFAGAAPVQQDVYQGQGEVLYDARLEQQNGGQYVALAPEPRPFTTALPPPPPPAPSIYDNGAGEQQFAAAPRAPVYTGIGQRPPPAPPEMIEISSGDILSSIVSARANGAFDFAVYFGFDSDTITPEGEDVLSDAVERLILENRNTISLMGFTDSAGDSRYNQLLAMRRANAVRSYIQRRADRPIRFRIMPVGEAEAVKTGGDGVTEALNRRVEIMLE